MEIFAIGETANRKGLKHTIGLKHTKDTANHVFHQH
jgi:hypothetical protein